MAEEKLPVFNLKAVVQETGVAAPKLRTWERRYGLPRPDRAPSGNRLYSRRDIETVRWLAARQSEGMTIGRAVALWRSLEEAGQDPLSEHIQPSPMQTKRETLERWREVWVAACLALDESAANAAFGQALTLAPPEVACVEVLGEGLTRIGEAWYQGHATVHQEHFASGLALRQVQALITDLFPPSRPDSLLVVCPPGEHHTFGPLLFTYLLRRAGWRAFYLGADLPVEEVTAAARRTAPRWVIATAAHLPTVVGIQALGLSLQDVGVPLAFGGRIFNRVPALRTRIHGYFLGEQMEEAPARLEEWAVRPPAPPTAVPVPETYRQAQIRYLEQEPFIGARVFALLLLQSPTRNLPDWLRDYFLSHIRAALILGDMGLADFCVDWLRGLRDGFSLPDGWVKPFLMAYRKGIEQHLGGDGAPILEWLDRHIDAEDASGNFQEMQ